MFFNLVLAKKAVQPTGCKDRHDLPPLDGPKTLPESVGQGKGRGKTKGKTKGSKGSKGQQDHSVGHWILLHHTPKLLVKPASKSSLLWWHPTEHLVWSRGISSLPKRPWGFHQANPPVHRPQGISSDQHPTFVDGLSTGGAVTESCVVRYADSHSEALERHSDDPPGTWRTKKGVPVQLTSS